MQLSRFGTELVFLLLEWSADGSDLDFLHCTFQQHHCHPVVFIAQILYESLQLVSDDGEAPVPRVSLGAPHR